jgi:hypothetical protein
MKMIHIKRVYEPAAKEDGARFLVERLWPRRMKKEALPMEDLVQGRSPERRSAPLVQPRSSQMEGIPTTLSDRASRQSCNLPTAVGRCPAGQHYAPIQRSRHET